MLHYRGGRKMIDPYSLSATIHGVLSRIWDRLMGSAWSRDFYAAGCRYLQLDDLQLRFILCNSAQRQMLADRGDDPDPARPRFMRALINAALERGEPNRSRQSPRMFAVAISDRPSSPRAVTKRSPICCSTGGQCRRLLPRSESDRAGGFEPLRLLPKGKTVAARPDHVQDRRNRKQGFRQAPYRRGRPNMHRL